MSPGQGLALAIWAAVATSAHAAPPPTTLPAVKAWASRNLTGLGRAPILGFNALGVTFISPRGATIRPDGLLEIEVRQEFFEPVALDDDVMRSSVGLWTLDCVGQRYAVRRMTLFAANDLKDQLSEQETEPPVWLPRDAISEPALGALCRSKK